MADPLFDVLNGGGASAALPSPSGPDPLAAVIGLSASAPPVNLPSPQAPAPAPAQSSSFLSQVRDFGSAALHHVQKPFHGLAQLVENGVASGADLIDPNYSRNLSSTVTGKPQRSGWNQAIQDVVNSDNQALQQWESDYQKNTPDSAGAYAGATVGEVAPFLVSATARGLNAVGDATASLLPKTVLGKAVPQIVPKVVSGATQGATLALTSPVTDSGNYWDQKSSQVKSGAVMGGAVPVVAAGAKGVWNAARPVLAPGSVVGDALDNWIGSDASKLTGFPNYVPGSRPTTAQVVANPNIVAAEKALANNPTYKPLFDARANANNAARWQVINDVAGTPEQLTQAIQNRADAAAPAQRSILANGNPVPVNDLLPQIRNVQVSDIGMRPTISGAARDIADAIQQRSTVTPPNTITNTPGTTTIRPGALDVVRQNVNDYLSAHAPTGFVGTQQQLAMSPVKSAITQAIEDANPGYKAYLEQYANMSVPINTMEAGQEMVNTLGARALDSSGQPALTLPGFNAQLKKALSTEYGISPQAQTALEGVQADLQRGSISNSLRVPGSDTSYNLQAPGVMGKLVYGTDFKGGKVLPAVGGLLGGGIGYNTGGIYGAGTGLAAGAMAGKKVADFASSRVNGKLADALLNPDVAKALLDSQKNRSILFQRLTDRVPLAGLLGLEAATVPSGGLLKE